MILISESAAAIMLMILPLIAILLLVATKPEGWKRFNDNFHGTLPIPKELHEMPKLSAKDTRYVALVGVAALVCAEVIFFAIAVSAWFKQPTS